MTDPTIPELVARLRELHEKATPGPWGTHNDPGRGWCAPNTCGFDRRENHRTPPYFCTGPRVETADQADADAALIAAVRSALPTLLDALEREQEPVPMVLFCPNCGDQHIDKPDPSKGWENPPHRSHLCLGCGCIWRPADVPTMGVVATQTEGRADTWHGSRAEPHGDGDHSPADELRPQVSLPREIFEVQWKALVQPETPRTPRAHQHAVALCNLGVSPAQAYRLMCSLLECFNGHFEVTGHVSHSPDGGKVVTPEYDAELELIWVKRWLPIPPSDERRG